MPAESTAFFDWVSNRSSKQPQSLGRTAHATVEAHRPHLTRDDDVLDYGCGTGDLTIAVAEQVSAVHALDTSAGMLDVATSRANRRGVDNITFAHSSVFDESHRPGAFTVVTAFNILHYLEDIPEASRRINDLLTPGGLFISSTACLAERRSLLGMLAGLLTRLQILPDTHFLKKSELEALIASGGFEIAETKDLSRLPDRFIVAKKTQ